MTSNIYTTSDVNFDSEGVDSKISESDVLNDAVSVLCSVSIM